MDDIRTSFQVLGRKLGIKRNISGGLSRATLENFIIWSKCILDPSLLISASIKKMSKVNFIAILVSQAEISKDF